MSQIDKVATAIAVALGEGIHAMSPGFQNAARAAIEAMREPTTAQLAAGQDAWLKDDLRRSSTLYRAMISAALSGGDGK